MTLQQYLYGTIYFCRNVCHHNMVFMEADCGRTLMVMHNILSMLMIIDNMVQREKTEEIASL